jgi:hypothetical protein
VPTTLSGGLCQQLLAVSNFIFSFFIFHLWRHAANPYPYTPGILTSIRPAPSFDFLNGFVKILRGVLPVPAALIRYGANFQSLLGELYPAVPVTALKGACGPLSLYVDIRVDIGGVAFGLRLLRD